MSEKLLLVLLGFIVVKGDNPLANLLEYEKYTIVDTSTVCSYFSTADVTRKCAEQLEIVCENSTLWMTILDASSKFPYTGLGYVSRNDYGNYDQCLSVDHQYEGGRILGEHCTYGLAVPDIFGNISDQDSYYTLAVCRPNACTASDFNAITEKLLNISIGFFVDGACQTVESNTTFSTTDIVTLTIFAAVIILMILSSTYDVFLYFAKRESLNPLLIAFSVLSNGRKLLHISKHSSSKEQIEVFHGLRVISMMWIIAGHAMTAMPFIAVTDAARVLEWDSQFYAFYITAGPLAVDTFFFMSGFLLAFQYLKGKTKSLKDQISATPQMIIHRYLRLTPAMLMIYLVTVSIIIHLGSGPMYPEMSNVFTDPCKKYWWSFFLYIQNYYNYDDFCLTQTWYLSADMQMFLLSPLILIPLSLQLKKFGVKVPLVELLIFNVFWTFAPMILKLVFPDYGNDFDTHSRLIDYFIGVMLGAFMRAEIDKPFLNMIPERYRPIINLVLWPVIILGMLAVVLWYHEVYMNAGHDRTVISQSLMRPAWCIGLSWITYSCYHGYGGFVNWILCRPIFQVLGRLTYCIYLVHVTVMLYFFATIRTRMYFSDYNSMYQFCGHYIASVIVATFWTLAFESPLIIVEKYFLGGRTGRRDERQTQRNGDIEAISNR